jgi:hypothetical protein
MELKFVHMVIINIFVFNVVEKMYVNTKNCIINVLNAKEDLHVNIIKEEQYASSAPHLVPVNIANPFPLLVHVGSPIAFVATVCYILMLKFPENIN